MWQFLQGLRDQGFMPHGHCYLWAPDVLWTNLTADAFIALAYYSIPFALYYFVRKRTDLAFDWIFIMFAIFIFACGTTHLMEIWNIWHTDYRMAGYIKAATALASIVTGYCLWRLIPKALLLPSPQQLRIANTDLEIQIVERKKAELELRKLNNELERRVEQRTKEMRRSNEDLEQFAYIASHDLQQPLRTITTMVQLLEKNLGSALHNDTKEYVALAQNAALKAQHLIRELLSYSRIGVSNENLTLVDCQEILRLACENLSSEIESSKINIQKSSLPTIQMNSAQMLQLFQNLLANSIKYRSSENPSIEISAKENEEDWVFSFKDNGIGISLQHQDRIFEMFKRLHPDHEFPGTGMGLAICKKIIERAGGRIWVESEIGKGSNFFFTLPKQVALEAV